MSRTWEALSHSLDGLIKEEGSLYERLMVAFNRIEPFYRELDNPMIKKSIPEEIREQLEKVVQHLKSLDSPTDQDKLEEVADEIKMLYNDVSRLSRNKIYNIY